MELNASVRLEWLNYEIILRLGVAAILGLVLGLDREFRGHAAGMRTHGLICVSAAPTVIGAGLIVFSKGQLHNLTAAAHLWLATILGIACGAGQWPLVSILTVVSLIMVTILRIVEAWFGHDDRRLGGADDGQAD